MISNFSHVDPNAKIGKNVSIGPYTIVHSNVIIGDNTIIEGYCELGVQNSLCDNTPLIISENSLIRSHSIFYASSVFGKSLVTGHRVTVREKTKAGDCVQIGTLGDIQGHCEIGDYVKMHSNVHIGQHSKICDYVWLFPYVVLTNDPHPPSEYLLGCEIGSFSVVATMSVVLPGVKIGQDVFVGAHSLISKNVPDEMIIAGNPAKVLGHVSKIKLKDGTKRAAYPWRRHFHRGYPDALIENWMKEFNNKI